MKRLVPLVLILSGLAGCAALAPAPVDLSPPEGMLRPVPRPGEGAARPPEGANTAEAFDTTTPAERAAALAAPQPAGEVKLGRTVAALGNPADPGFWLETPLAERAGPGRVVAVASGASVQLDLRPIEGPEGAGSRISLAALRLLGLGLAGLHELDVYAQ